MIYRKHFLPDREHGFSITKTDQLILLREIDAVHCHSHTKYIDSVDGLQGLSDKSSGTYGYHCALYG